MEEKVLQIEPEEQTMEEIALPAPPEDVSDAPSGDKVFLGEEDKRLLRKFNRHIVNKLGLSGNRSFKV